MQQRPETLFERFSREPVNLGRMNDPSGSAWIKGLCGDTMEMYLSINEGTITDARFFTDGCAPTHACGSLVTRLVKGRTIKEALALSPAAIVDRLENLPAAHLHCAILAVSTLHKAIADYLLQY